MNGNALRNHALDEMHHRLRQVRSYSLVDEDGSKITVHAALVKSDPQRAIQLIKNPPSRARLRICARLYPGRTNRRHSPALWNGTHRSNEH
jgi:hypothetical protein